MGHWFWNNNNGADLFCKMKMHSSYATGRITAGEKFGSKLPITSAGLLLGICREDDADIFHCTGGYNWSKDKANTYCHAGRDDAGLKIVCEDNAITFEDSKYIFMDDPRTVDEAEAYCNDNNFDLVSIES